MKVPEMCPFCREWHTDNWHVCDPDGLNDFIDEIVRKLNDEERDPR